MLEIRDKVLPNRIDQMDTRLVTTLFGLSYVKANRVLDLNSPIDSSTTTLADRSGNGNDATPRTGRFGSTDGVADKAINADCSALGSGDYYLTGWVRPDGVTTAELTMDGSTDSGLTGLTADVWQQFSTATATGITPSLVALGWDGSNFSAADWSDVRLVDANDPGRSLPRWQLTESADGDLDGYPAIDSSGNGYHGTHTGCAGGSGEADILQTAGQDWNRYWGGGQTATWSVPNADRIRFGVFFYEDYDKDSPNVLLVNYNTATESPEYILLGDWTSSLTDEVISIGSDTSSDRTGVTGITIPAGSHDIEFAWNSGASRYDILLDGVAQTVVPDDFNNGHVQKSDVDFGSGRISTRKYAQVAFVEYVEIYDSSGTLAHRYENGSHLDQTGSVNLSGPLALVPASDENNSEDALGQPIDPATKRINGKVVNLIDDSVFVQLPDDSSLESVRSVTLALYNDGGTKDILQAADTSIFVDIAGDVLQSDLTTSATYVNGASGTALNAGWNIVTLVFDAGKDLSDGRIVGTSGSLLAYDPKALTADEALQNFNAFKSQYGL